MIILQVCLFFGLLAYAIALPVDNPHLYIKVSNPGGAGSFGAQVSKAGVNLETDGKVKEEPFVPHRPPFLAFKEGPIYSKPPASPQYFPAQEKQKVKRKVDASKKNVSSEEE